MNISTDSSGSFKPEFVILLTVEKLKNAYLEFTQIAYISNFRNPNMQP